MSEKNEVAVQGIAGFLATPAIKENIESVVGKEHATQFISDVVSCVQNNNTLAVCTNKSILSGALLAKAINLPLTPQLGYAYLVPFDNKKQVKTEDGRTETKWVKEAQFQMGYKGYVQLALRSGRYKKLFATDVRKGEVVNFNPFEDTFELSPVEFEKRTAKDDKGNFIVPVIGYYAKFELMNGFVKELYMTHEDMLEYANKYSKAYRSDMQKRTSYSFWTTKFEDMAKKTMLRQLLGKWGLLTPEMEKAYTCDMAVIDEVVDEDGTRRLVPNYADNQPDDTEPTVNPMADVIEADYKEIDEQPMPDNFA